MSQLLLRKVPSVFGGRTHNLRYVPSVSRARLVDRSLQNWRHLGRQYSYHPQQISIPPKTGGRLIIWSFIGTNGLVFLWWVQATIRARDGDPTDTSRHRGFISMMRNYTLSLENWRQGRWFTALTHTISHRDFAHLLFNMISFHAFTSCAVEIGLRAPTVLALGLGSAVASSAATLFDFRRKKAYDAYALGASGVVSGIGAAMACLVPTQPFYLFFIPVGIPLWVLTLGYIAYDSFRVNSGSLRVGHAAHLGGAAFGVLFYALRLRKFGGVAGLWRLYMGRGMPTMMPPKPPPRPPPSRHQPTSPPKANPTAQRSRKQKR